MNKQESDKLHFNPFCARLSIQLLLHTLIPQSTIFGIVDDA